MVDEEPGGVGVSALLAFVAELTGEGRTITIPRTYVEWLDGDYAAAIVLNDCVYWTAWAYGEGRDGWFYRNEDDWLQATRLSRKQVVRAVNAINARAHAPLIERTTRRANGSPTMHFRVNADVYGQYVRGEWKLPKGQSPNAPKGKVQPADSAKSLTEPTAEPTAEKRPAGGSRASTRNDQRVWGYVNAWFSAKGVKRSTVPEPILYRTYDALKRLPDTYDAEDVRGCTAYLLQVDAFREPGKLSVQRVIQDLPDWIVRRPEAPAPRRNGNGRSDDILDGILDDVLGNERSKR